uniref:C-type lectin domain-containing protein n=1 Tax=Anopheles culicifacies TaxID=139723 RepID=A0A182M041_9DIPT
MSYQGVILLVAVSVAVGGISGIYVVERGGKKSFVRLGPHHWTDGAEDGGLWSSLLEEYTVGLNHSATSAPRESRVMQATVVAAPAPKYIPTSSFYINKRIGEALELDPQHQPQQHHTHRVPAPPVGKVIASTGAGGLYGDNHLSGANHGATFTPMRQTFGGASPTELLASPREVSETDLYLLGAIEKLVYRVDYMENRLRRAEQIIYFLMAGNSQKQDFWLGGLNPGLLWIWANSAKPVNPNTNLSSITTSSKPGKGTSGTTSTPKTTTNLGNGTDASGNTKIVNNTTNNQPTLEITGNGRCLRLSYNSALYTYGYRGEDCSAQFSYVCELKDKSLDNEISRIAKQLKLADDVS